MLEFGRRILLRAARTLENVARASSRNEMFVLLEHVGRVGMTDSRPIFVNHNCIVAVADTLNWRGGDMSAAARRLLLGILASCAALE